MAALHHRPSRHFKPGLAAQAEHGAAHERHKQKQGSRKWGRTRTSSSEPPPKPSMALTVDVTKSSRAASATSVGF